MLPPSDSATYWPIRNRAHWFHLPLKNFSSSPFWKSPRAESTRPAAKKDLSLSSSSTDTPHGRSLLKITLLPAIHTKEPALRPATRATCYSEYLLQTQEPTYYLRHQKEPFLALTQVYFCNKNKPLVVVFQRSFVIYFVLQINL